MDSHKSKGKLSKKRAHEFNYFLCNQQHLLLLTGFIALGYFIFSFVFDGFYQHDEVGHFLSMQNFWSHPNGILSNWAKPGYKLLYAIPALGGKYVVIIFNCLIAAFTCYFTYRISEKQGLKYPLIVFLMLALQPMWVQITHRHYAEVPTAFIYVLVLFFFKDKKYFLSALCLSYACFIRQESYPIALVLGIYLLSKKEWLAFLALGIFPFVHNLWGGLSNGDPLFLYNMIVGTSESIKTMFPRQGGQHYFVTSMVVFGPVIISLFVAYFAQYINTKFKIDYDILTMFSIYFLEHVVFSIQSLDIGPATGGNLRYMIVVSPFLALIAGISLEKFMNLKSINFKIYLVLGIYLILVLVFMTYHHNNIVLIPQKRYIFPFLAALSTIIVLLIKMESQLKLGLMTALIILSTVIFIKPLKMHGEDLAIKNTVDYIKQHKPDFENQIWTSHALLKYFVDPLDWKNLGDTTHIQKGDLVVWESHYSKRFTGLEHTDFLNKTKQYKVFYYKQIPRRFAIIVFEKL